MVTEERRRVGDGPVGMDCGREGAFKDCSYIDRIPFQKAVPFPLQKEQQIQFRG